MTPPARDVAYLDGFPVVPYGRIDGTPIVEVSDRLHESLLAAAGSDLEAVRDLVARIVAGARPVTAVTERWGVWEAQVDTVDPDGVRTGRTVQITRTRPGYASAGYFGDDVRTPDEDDDAA